MRRFERLGRRHSGGQSLEDTSQFLSLRKQELMQQVEWKARKEKASTDLCCVGRIEEIFKTRRHLGIRSRELRTEQRERRKK
jgi:hypothetical protein